jgi:hypothetical protein
MRRTVGSNAPDGERHFPQDGVCPSRIVIVERTDTEETYDSGITTRRSTSNSYTLFPGDAPPDPDGEQQMKEHLRELHEEPVIEKAVAVLRDVMPYWLRNQNHPVCRQMFRTVRGLLVVFRKGHPEIPAPPAEPDPLAYWDWLTDAEAAIERQRKIEAGGMARGGTTQTKSVWSDVPEGWRKAIEQYHVEAEEARKQKKRLKVETFCIKHALDPREFKRWRERVRGRTRHRNRRR